MSTVNSTLDGLIDAARREVDQLPALAEPANLGTEARWWTEQRWRVRWGRRVGLGGGMLAVVMQWSAGRVLTEYWTSTILATLLVAALVLAGRRGALAQIGSRAALWALALFAGGVWWIFWPWTHGLPDAVAAYSTREMGGVIGVSADLMILLVPLAALLVLGMHGLERPAEPHFRPTAFRRLLGLSLVMGLADAILLLSAGVVVLLTTGATGLVPWILVIWLLLGAWGLYRLRTWGLAVMALGNVAEVVYLSTSHRELFGDEMLVLVVTAVVQVLLPIPVYGAMLRGRVGAHDKWAALGARVPTLLLAGLAMVAVGQWAYIVALLP